MTREEKARFCIDHPHKSPAFQFYPDNWWGSRHVAAMTIEQRGIHASLLFSAWLELNCGIPENEFCLSARITEAQKPIASQVLSWCWFLYHGFWFCERLLNERIKQVELTNIRKEVGSLGGRPVLSRTKKKKPIANLKDSKHKPNDNQTEEEEEIVIEDVIVNEIPLHLKEVWPAFIEVRKDKGAVNSPRAIKMIINELNKLSTDPATQVKIIEQSIRSSWKDVYQLKEENHGSNQRSGSGSGSKLREKYEGL